MENQPRMPIACMPSETHQIFANLMANAIEAMQRNGTLIIRMTGRRATGAIKTWRNAGDDLGQGYRNRPGNFRADF